MSNDDDNLLDDEARAALPVVPPPADFADRVMTRLSRPEPAPAPAPPPRRRWGSLVGSLALVAAVLIAVAVRWPRGGAQQPASSGELTAEQRSTVPVGPRTVAVLEAGAHLAYRHQPGGTEVVQDRGDVFYRVAPALAGEAFVVKTPAGDVVVRGTCFRVEVTNMKGIKQALGGAAAGTLITAAVLVTVYEGRVSFANPHGTTEVAAGERAVARAGSAPGPATDVAVPAAVAGDLTAPPPPTASREELLARDGEQRRQLAALRARLTQLESTGTGTPGKKSADDKEPDNYVDIPKEELVKMAGECRLRWDTPSLDPGEGAIDPDQAAQAGLSPDQARALNKAMNDFQMGYLADVRALYIEVTGDTHGADELSAQSMMQEIEKKSSRRDVQLAYQRISAERAGLAAAPTDLAKLSPYERMARLHHGAGDAAEKAIAQVIGADLASQLRMREGGWGWRHSSSHGCPK